MIDLCMLCAWQLVYVKGYEGGMVWRAALPGFSYDETQMLKRKSVDYWFMLVFFLNLPRQDFP